MSRNKIYTLLFEEEARLADAPESNIRFKGDTSAKARKSADSVDDQIDSLLLMYEQKSIREKDELMETLKNLSLRMLLEQEEEDPLADIEEEEPAGEEEADMDAEEEIAEPEGSEKMTTTVAATKEQIPEIDIDKFTIKVARLVMNYRNLLRVEDVIINRAKNFLDENYGDKFVSKYLEILDEQFGLEPEEFPQVEYSEDDDFAVGANPAGAGMAGGGA